MFHHLTAGPEYIQFFFFFITTYKYHILKIVKLKCDIIQPDFKRMVSILSNLYNFHSHEQKKLWIALISETQLQVNENSNKIISWLKS